MEAIKEIEFSGDLVADPSRDTLTIKMLINVDTRIQSPGALRVMRVGEPAQVVVQADVDVESPDNPEPRSVLYENKLSDLGDIQSRCLE